YTTEPLGLLVNCRKIKAFIGSCIALISVAVPPHRWGLAMHGYCSRNILLLTLLVLAGLAAGCSVGAKAPTAAAVADKSGSQQLPFTENKPLVVPANTAIYVRLQQSISSSTAQSGQNFSAVL